MPAVFAYGTLRDPEVQRQLLGREVPAEPDRLFGHRTGTIIIGGETYPLAVPDPGSTINGSVLDVTPEELRKMDEYETSAYERRELPLESGRRAWVYLGAAKK